MFVPTRPTPENSQILERIDESRRNDLVRSCVQALIVLSQDKTPIKKSELNKLVFANVKPRTVGAIIQLANRELNKTFGMRLFETPDKTKYLLVNSRSELGAAIPLSDEDCEEATVLFFVLMEIFGSPDEHASYPDLTSFLKYLDLKEGNLDAYLDTFVRKLYLTVQKRSEDNVYSWGPRALAEVDPDAFFEKFLLFASNTNEKDWPDHKNRIDRLKAMAYR